MGQMRKPDLVLTLPICTIPHHLPSSFRLNFPTDLISRLTLRTITKTTVPQASYFATATMLSEESQIWGETKPSKDSLTLPLSLGAMYTLLPATHGFLLFIELFSIPSPLTKPASHFLITLVLALHIYIYGLLGLVNSALERRIEYISPTATFGLDYASALGMEMERKEKNGWEDKTRITTMGCSFATSTMLETSSKSYGWNEASWELVANPWMER